MFNNINFIFSKALIFLLIFFLQAAIVVGQQVPSKAWDKTYGGSSYDYANSIQQTLDGGYIVAGSARSNNGDITSSLYSNDTADYWIIKLDGLGNKVWDKTFGGSNIDEATSIQETSDSGYIVVGSTKSNNGDISDGNNGDYDYWIIKLDGLGNKVWDKTYGGSSYDYANSIQQTSDGGYIVAGSTRSNDGDITSSLYGNDTADYWIVKLDGLGNKVWDKTYGGSEEDYPESIQQTSDGGYIVAGSTKSNNGDISDFNNGKTDYWIIKLDSVGNKEWNKTYGGSSWDRAHSIQQTSDGGYILAGNTSSNSGDISDGNNGKDDYWIIKLDGSGNKEWDKTYGGSYGDYPESIQQTSEGGYIVAGSTYSNDGDISDGNNGYIYQPWFSDYWIIKLDGSGNKEWDKTYGGKNSDAARSIQQNSDGGYIVAGYTFSNDGDNSDGYNGGGDYWILKLDMYTSYDITYQLDGAINNPENPSSYIELDSITLNPATKTGYIFEGWFTDSTYSKLINYIPKGSKVDISLWAKFYDIYNITYHLDGAINHIKNPSSYIQLDSITLKPAIKTQFIFEGWFTDSSFTNPINTISTGVTGDIDLWAKLVPKSQCVHHEAVRNGDFEFGYLPGGTIGTSIASHTFTPGGFLDFESDLDYSGEWKAPNNPCLWGMANQYGVGRVENTTNYCGHGNAIVYGRYTSANKYKDHTTGTDKGFSMFIDFNAVSGIFKHVWEQTVDIYGSQKYYFSVWFAQYGGEQAGPNLRFKVEAFDSLGTLIETRIVGNAHVVPPAMQWQQFNGTYDTPPNAVTAVISIECNPTGLSSQDDLMIDDISFITYCKEVYNITYHLDGAVNNPDNSQSYTELDSLTLYPATKTDYTFGGWFTDSTFTNPISEISTGTTGDIELWAKFDSQITYVIDLEQNMFSLYPNPANAKIILKTNKIQALGEVLITDMTGKIVKQFQTQKSTTEIDVSTLENGIYFVKAGGVSQKLVKK